MNYYYTLYKGDFKDGGFDTLEEAQKSIVDILWSEVEERCANEYDPEILVEDFTIEYGDDNDEASIVEVDNGITQEDVDDAIYWEQKDQANSGDPMTSEEFYRMVM